MENKLAFNLLSWLAKAGHPGDTVPISTDLQNMRLAASPSVRHQLGGRHLQAMTVTAEVVACGALTGGISL